MSEAFQYIDILILAIIAGIVLLRLRSVLGRRTGHEKTDKTSYNYETPQQSSEEKVVTIEPKVSSGSREDGWFDKDDFLRGASNAYEAIVTNFEKFLLNSGIFVFKFILYIRIFGIFLNTYKELVAKFL